MRIHRAYSRFHHEGAFRRAEVRPACQWVSFFSSCRVMVCWLNRAFRARASISSGGDCCKSLDRGRARRHRCRSWRFSGVPGPSPGGAEGGLPGRRRKGQTQENQRPEGPSGELRRLGGRGRGRLLGGFRCYCRLVGGGLPICRVGVRLGLRSCGRFTVEGGGYADR